MTKGQCRTAISQNQQNIRQYNSQIAQLKNDIDELNRVKGKIVELQNTLTVKEPVKLNLILQQA